MPSTEVYILLGSNLGDRERNLLQARRRLDGVEGLEVIASSGIYLSEAEGMEGENPSFLNQVVKGDYQFRAQELLDAMERIESALGRQEKGMKKPRPIDLDLLLFGAEVIETDRLTVPHPEILNRSFVMVPLLEIDPELMHPVTKKPIAEHVTAEGRREVLLYKDHVSRNG